jgi:hypothetical protein
MRGHAHPGHFRHFQLDIGVDQVVGADAARLEELTILVQILERRVQGMANRLASFSLINFKTSAGVMFVLAGWLPIDPAWGWACVDHVRTSSSVHFSKLVHAL